MAATSSVMSSKAAFVGKPIAVKSSRAKATRGFAVQAAARPVWFPGKPTPSYLNGSLAGDYGFDPLGLGSNPDALKWYVQAELIHARWAMAGVAGVLIPAVLTKIGALDVPAWYDAGLVAQDNSSIPFSTLLVIEHILLGFVEIKRLVDWQKPGSQAEPGSFLGFEALFKGTGENGYPGGPFDPLGYSKGTGYAEYKTKEIKNGRLAMLAFLGFAAQYYATGKDPLTNLGEHLADPWNNNFATNGVSLPFL